MASDLYTVSGPFIGARTRSKRRNRHGKTCPNFLDLPSEIMMRILDFSCNDPEEVAAVSLVCTLFNSMASSEALWRRVCLNRFGFVHPTTVTRSGSWKSLMRYKSAIENSPWAVKPRDPAQTLQNDLLGMVTVGKPFLPLD